MNSIRYLFRKEFVLFFLLFIMLLNPFYYGYRVAILFIFYIFFQSKKYIPLFDTNVLLLFLFSFSYELLGAMRIDAPENKTALSILPNIFIPSLLYLIGYKVSRTYRIEEQRIFFLFFLSVAVLIIPLISVLLQIMESGFESSNRSLYLIWYKDIEINATGMASYFTLALGSIGIINLKPINKVQKRVYISILILFLLSLLCIIRLGSRTQIIIIVFSFLISYLIGFSRKNMVRNIVFLFVGAGLFVYGFIVLSSIPEVELLFVRGDANEYGINTAGGRLERWIGSFHSIFTDPWGWEFSRYGYAHNFWLDVARISGVVPLIFLIIFTYASVKLFLRAFKKLKHSKYLRIYLLLIFLSLLLVFNVEPVMEGMYLMFLLFCMLIGFIKGIVVTKIV